MDRTTALLLLVVGLEAGIIALLVTLLHKSLRIIGRLVDAELFPQDSSLSSRLVRWLMNRRIPTGGADLTLPENWPDGLPTPEPASFVSRYE